MFDRTAIAWAICRAATPENLQELSNYGNAGPIADAVISAILEGMHAGGVSNKPLNPASLATPPAPNDDTVAFVQKWLMNADYDPSQFDKDFAAAIDARCATPARNDELRAALAWFSGQTRLSLQHYSPMYGDDDDQSVEWRVDRESGPINDREWETIARGETVEAAILAAHAAALKENRRG